MIDNIRLSEKAKQQLIAIKRKTGVENWNVLCRWALNLSLLEYSEPPFEDIHLDSSIEMSWKVFTGEYSDIYHTIFLQRLQRSSHINEHDYFKLHLHRGISYLHQKTQTIDDLFSLMKKL
ncbi:DNA sulfur modification protein DndE [Aeromonas veronii]